MYTFGDIHEWNVCESEQCAGVAESSASGQRTERKCVALPALEDRHGYYMKCAGTYNWIATRTVVARLEDAADFASH